MAIKVNEYVMEQSKVNGFRLVCISDIHGDAKALSQITKIVESKSPNCIAIPGDIVDTASQDKKKLYVELKRLLEIAPIVASIGNHDLEDHSDRGWIFKTDEEWEYMLKGLKQFILLDGTYGVYKLPNINVCLSAFNPDYVWYNKYKEDINQFYSEFNKIGFNGKLDGNNLNILLSHSPAGFVLGNKFVASDLSEDIQLFDLILSGHYHGGLTPKFIQEILKNHRGILSPGPKYQMFPGGAYGVYQQTDTALLISNGVNRLSNSTGIVSKFNGLYSKDIEVIDFTYSDNQNILIKK